MKYDYIYQNLKNLLVHIPHLRDTDNTDELVWRMKYSENGVYCMGEMTFKQFKSDLPISTILRKTRDVKKDHDLSLTSYGTCWKECRCGIPWKTRKTKAKEEKVRTNYSQY